MIGYNNWGKVMSSDDLVTIIGEKQCRQMIGYNNWGKVMSSDVHVK